MAYNGEIEIIQNSQDIANNCSSVTANFYAVSDSYAGWSNYTTYASCTLNGTTETKTITSFDFRTSKKILLGSMTKSVSHNSDGTKTVSASFSWDSDHSLVGTITASKSLTLTTIPRKSSISVTTANIESNATITINRASSSFTHTLTYKFGSLSGTIATKTSSTSIIWTIPASFYEQIPNNQSSTGTITCETFSGSTSLGTTTSNFTVTVNESNNNPLIDSAEVIDINETTKALTEDNTKLVLNKSTAQLTLTATLRNYAKLSSIVINGVAITATTSSSAGTTTATATVNYEEVTSSSFIIIITDTRKFSKQTVLAPDIVNYVPLTINASVSRPEPTTGEVALTSLTGNYFNGNFSSNIANELSIIWKYKLKSETEYTNGGTLTPIISDNNTYSVDAVSLGKIFDYQNVYDFQITATDELSTAIAGITVVKGKPILNWGEDFVNINGKLKIENEEIGKVNQPIGSLYLSVISTNPSNYFGGTWESIGAGRVLVGVDTSDSNFNTVEKTGGEATHTLTIDEIPAHSHNIKLGSGSASGTAITHPGTQTTYYNYADIIGSAGGSQPHNNLQPYITCYIWKRVA